MPRKRTHQGNRSKYYGRVSKMSITSGENPVYNTTKVLSRLISFPSL